jgi:serine phosphatase RsbU (regulator of sigma subunit)
MKKLVLDYRYFTTVRLFALVFAFAVIAPGCGKFKEEFNRGIEGGKRRAELEKNANADPNTNSAAPKPNPTPLVLSADNLRDERLTNLHTQIWRYKSGDDANWALPETSDADWETLPPETVSIFAPPKSGWNGVGWFRLRLAVDESLGGQPLGLAISQPGASEIYVDGKLVQSFGTVSADAGAEKVYNPRAMPLGVNLAPGAAHLIAVRYSNTQAKKYPFEPLAFKVRVAPLNATITEFLNNTALTKSVRGGTFGVCLALGLLHLLLFMLYPRQRGNLFYSIFLLSEATSIVAYEAFSSGGMISSMLIGMFTGAVYFTAFLAYLYTVLENRLPRYLRVTAGLWLLSAMFVILSSLGFGTVVSFLFFIPGFLIFFTVMIWNIVSVSIVIVRAVRRKVDNSWILGIVGAAFVIASLSSTVLGIAFGENSPNLYIGQFICLTALIIANAVFLARQFARTSTDLEAQLVKAVEHEKEKSRLLVVEAENERRAQELEEARQLQFSMLPKNLPVIPNLEIAAYMKPATEVGGDYYDFHVGSEGTLTVAVGDATGHGLRAGSVVTATKSLFNAFAGQENIPQILSQTSSALKKMNLRGLFMAMAMLKIKDGAMNLCVAGMPSVLIYRAMSETVEEISLRAMPLGSMTKTNYQEREITLASGDCVVLMSDGFPEMFNPENEMLGFEKAAEVLPDIAGLSSQEIINHLVSVGENWAGARPADDDVTFVVLKVGNNGN